MIPAIFGCEGLTLSEAERSFFKEAQPAGYILFARNIQDPAQVRALTDEIRAISGENTFILIDQEGGRVQRMSEPHWRKYPPMGFFGELAKTDRAKGFEALKLNVQLIAHDLLDVGVNVDCLPLLDVPIDGADQIIGDRAFSSDIQMIADMGQMVIDTLMECGVFPVIKHIPGHGRALVDSHLSLPEVGKTRDILSKSDFAPFKALQKAPFAMTAHIVYTDIDPDAPATQSKHVINEIIRGEIGFDGLLMTDDLSMKALSGAMAGRATASLDAGCDLLLHCNGDMTEMIEIAGAASKAGSTEIANRLSKLAEKLEETSVVNVDNVYERYQNLVAS
jgi:beta-N-acetylhexosaminidase